MNHFFGAIRNTLPAAKSLLKQQRQVSFSYTDHQPSMGLQKCQMVNAQTEKSPYGHQQCNSG